MNINKLWCEDQFPATPSSLAEALDKLVECDALALRLLSDKQCKKLVVEADHLDYRPAVPVVGMPGSEVFQDFMLCMNFPDSSPFLQMGKGISNLLKLANNHSSTKPLPGSFCFNDFIVQDYSDNSEGMSPHRDHIRYINLVALVLLEGEADFSVCEDRSGKSSKVIQARPGDVILMKAPGFCGEDSRPFHQVRNIKGRRLIVGLRQDSYND